MPKPTCRYIQVELSQGDQRTCHEDVDLNATLGAWKSRATTSDKQTGGLARPGTHHCDGESSHTEKDRKIKSLHELLADLDRHQSNNSEQ